MIFLSKLKYINSNNYKSEKNLSIDIESIKTNLLDILTIKYHNYFMNNPISLQDNDTFNSYLYDFREKISETIKTYEKRLNNIKIDFIKKDSFNLELVFIIYASLLDVNNTDIVFELIFDYNAKVILNAI